MRQSFATQVVLGAAAPKPVNEPEVLPIFQSAGWVFHSLDEVDAVYEGRAAGAVYGGSGVPNHQALEHLVAGLHGGEAALATASGMAAFTAVLLHAAQAGTHILAANDLYGSSTSLLTYLAKFNLQVDFGDAADPDAAFAGTSGTPALVIVETISNPRVRVADLRALARLAHERGALLVVDNTLASPFHCRPLELGADLVIESGTKFLGGHHDLVLGAVIGARSLIDPMRTLAARAGLVAPAFESWLAVRSIATLDLRMHKSAESALLVARWLAQHPKIRATHYAGVADTAQRAIAERTLHNGFGSVVSFEITPERAVSERFLNGLTNIKLVLSFGGVATTVSHPATSSHRSLEAKRKQALGIHDGFWRLSVGIEDVRDIIDDLEHGLSEV